MVRSHCICDLSFLSLWVLLFSITVINPSLAQSESPTETMQIPLKLMSQDVRFARPCSRHGKILHSFGTYKENGLLLPHTGIEFYVPNNTRLTSCSNGVVDHVGFMPGLGTLVIVKHGGGYHTVMGPLSENSILVSVGDVVVQGQTLGQVKNASQDKVTFVHLELRKDTIAIDPTFLLE